MHITSPSLALRRLTPRLFRPALVTTTFGKHRRTYYSEQFPAAAPYSPAEDAILSAALSHVPRHGFSSRSIALGASDAGYPEVSTQLFPQGVFDLIRFHLVTQRRALKDNVQFPEDAPLGVGRRIRTLTLARLRANKDIIYQWQGVSAARPLSLPCGLLVTLYAGFRSHVPAGQCPCLALRASCAF